MKEALLALITGGICGAVFAFLRLPVPAPPVLPGVLGVVGVFAGYRLVLMLLAR